MESNFGLGFLVVDGMESTTSSGDRQSQCKVNACQYW